MPTLPPLTSKTDVAQLVKDKNKLYQPQGPRIPGDPARQNLPTNATPAAMKILLDELKKYTERVQLAAANEGVESTSIMAQWQSDMSNWVARMNHYYEVLKTVGPEQANTDAGADAIYFFVTSPLLDGVYYEVLPGTVLDQEERDRIALGPPAGFSNQKPPDIYIPFSLGNQVLVFRDAQRANWDKFWDDVWSNTKALPGKVGKAAEKAGWIVAPWVLITGAIAVTTMVAGAIVYGVYQYNKAKAMSAGASRPGGLPPGVAEF